MVGVIYQDTAGGGPGIRPSHGASWVDVTDPCGDDRHRLHRRGSAPDLLHRRQRPAQVAPDRPDDPGRPRSAARRDPAVSAAAGQRVAVRPGLRKRYAGRPVVDGLSFNVAAGTVFAMLGPNGAGKTTTVEILEGYRRADEGEVRVLGLDPARWPRRAPGPGRADAPGRRDLPAGPVRARSSTCMPASTASPGPRCAARAGRPGRRGDDPLQGPVRRPEAAPGAGPRAPRTARAGDPGRADGGHGPGRQGAHPGADREPPGRAARRSCSRPTSWPMSSSWPTGSRSSIGAGSWPQAAPAELAAGAQPRLRFRLDRGARSRADLGPGSRRSLGPGRLLDDDDPAATGSMGSSVEPGPEVAALGRLVRRPRRPDRRGADDRIDPRGALPRADRRAAARWLSRPTRPDRQQRPHTAGRSAQLGMELRLTARRGENLFVIVVLPLVLLVFFSLVPGPDAEHCPARSTSWCRGSWPWP